MKFKHYHIIIGAFLFALLMWVSVNMTYDYATTYTIPIKLDNLPTGKILKYPIPKNLYLRIKGSGWHLTSLFISGNLELIIDGTKFTANTVTFTDALVVEKIKLPTPISILDLSPDSLNFVIEDCLTKKVIVKPLINLDFLEGYGQVGDIEVFPDSILVKGSQSNIGSIDDWRTKPVTLNKLSKPVHVKLPLQEPPEYIIKIEQKEVDLRINVQPFAEKSYTGINIETHYLPVNREVIFIPPKMDVILRGSIENLSYITNDSISAYVDFTTLVSDTSGYVNPEVNLPAGVKIIKTFPDKFQFIIRKRL
jgi:YbbR domain-containing protein